MSQIEEATARLATWTERLHAEMESGLQRVREATDPAEAELELASILRQLDEVNEAAGDCLAAVRESRPVTV